MIVHPIPPPSVQALQHFLQVPSNLKLSLLLFTFFLPLKLIGLPKTVLNENPFFSCSSRDCFLTDSTINSIISLYSFHWSQKSRIPEVVSVTCSRNSLLNTHPNITPSSVSSNKKVRNQEKPNTSALRVRDLLMSKIFYW